MSAKESVKQWNLVKLVSCFLNQCVLFPRWRSCSNRLHCPFYYRAVYYKADIYILDDPLSAVDVRVGRKLFDEWVLMILSSRKCKFIKHHSLFFYLLSWRQNILPRLHVECLSVAHETKCFHILQNCCPILWYTRDQRDRRLTLVNVGQLYLITTRKFDKHDIGCFIWHLLAKLVVSSSKKSERKVIELSFFRTSWGVKSGVWLVQFTATIGSAYVWNVCVKQKMKKNKIE